jgi:anti-sigma factor RsiW
MGINCENFKSSMMKYMDGTITDTELSALNEHISHCDVCKREFSVYRDILSGFNRLSEPAPDIDFTEKVMHSVAMTKSPHKGLAFLVVCSIISAFSSVAGFLKLVALNRTQVMMLLSENKLLSPLSKAINIIADADITITSALQNALLAIDSYRDTLMLILFTVGIIALGIITTLHKSAIGGIRK